MATSITSFSDLTPQNLLHILSFLPAKEVATAAAVQRLWRDVSGDGLLWKQHLLTDYGVQQCQGPSGETYASQRLAYNCWRSRYPPIGAEISRATSTWQRTEAWLTANCPSIRGTLLPGATLEELAQAEQLLGAPFPPALRALYGVHSGQALLYETSRDRSSEAWRESLLHGLFGGYCFYDYLVCVRMLSLPRAVSLTQQLKAQAPRHPRLPADARVLAFAVSFQGQKVFVVNLDTGAISVNNDRSVFLPAAPPDSVPGARDGVLRWFEEYAERLGTGMYTYCGLDEELPAYRGICLFPQQPPQVRAAVTRGVRVRASALYVPERSGGPHGNLFTYSIRFSLLSAEEQAAQLAGAQALAPAGATPEDMSVDDAPAAAAAPQAAAAASTSTSTSPTSTACGVMHSCQLLRRHWVIRGAHGEVVDEVAGDGVVGKYPLLKPGEPEFVYQSCTYTPNDPTAPPAPPGSAAGRVTGGMGGSFEFVPGSVEEPEGSKWDVLCPDFHLALPGYVY